MKKLLILLSATLAAVGATAGTALTVVSCNGDNSSKTKTVTKDEAVKEIHAGLKKALKIYNFKSEVAKSTETSVNFNLLLDAKKGYKLNFDGKLSFDIKMVKMTVIKFLYLKKQLMIDKKSEIIGNGFHVSNAEIAREQAQKVTYNLSVVAEAGYKLTFNGSTSIAVDVFNRDEAIAKRFETLNQHDLIVDLDIKTEPETPITPPDVTDPVITTRTKRSVDDTKTEQAKILEQVSKSLEMDSTKYKVEITQGNLSKQLMVLNCLIKISNEIPKHMIMFLNLVKALDQQNNSKPLDIIFGKVPIVGDITADPTTPEGKKIYEDFQTNLITTLQKVLKTAGDLLSSLGMDSIEIGGQKVKITDLLDVNLFDIFGMKKETISIEQSIPVLGKISIKLDVKSIDGEYGVKIKDLISNIAPDLVDFVKFTLNENSFAKSKNRVNIEPSTIALNIANKFLKYDKSVYEGIDLMNDTSIFSDLALIKDIDVDGLKKDGAVITGLASMAFKPATLNGFITPLLPKKVVTNEEMLNKMLLTYDQQDIVICSAALYDYEVDHKFDTKLHKQDNLNLNLVKSIDVLEQLVLNNRTENILKPIIDKINEATAEKQARDKKRGLSNSLINALVIGIPNVGKSTFINRAVKGKKVGSDEAGRGAMAGPVVVASVILANDYQNPLINDSKKISSKVRDQLFDEIYERAIDVKVEIIDANEVDILNPKAASKLGMINSIKKLKITPEISLIDAEKLKR
ncbi:hypothetical protein FQA39_LY12917 [Lamprigera yunnana]|nr:hypothetical protein FQA39_LY12917 [Lamprigera yunnana]